MNKGSNYCFEDSYVMQAADIERFVDTLVAGFSNYPLFVKICGGEYDFAKMRLFWRVSLTLASRDAICIADSAEVNSVLIYLRPSHKEPGILSYLRAGGLKMAFRFGLKMSLRLIRFNSEASRVMCRHKSANDGYLMAFATRPDKQRQHYGAPLMQALLRHLEASGEGCYLETLKEQNIGLYEHWGFALQERATTLDSLPLYAMTHK